MPRRDGTGPQGKGPLTGRGLGVHGEGISFEEASLRPKMNQNSNGPKSPSGTGMRGKGQNARRGQNNSK